VDELKEAEARGSGRVQLTEARIRAVLEEAQMDRLQRQPGAAGAPVAGGSSSSSASAAAAAASPSIHTDANEMSEAEEGDEQNDADSPRAEAEGMAPSRSASELQSTTASEDDADGRTQAAAASSSSSAAAPVLHAKRKAADDMATEESPRAKKVPTPTNSAGRA